LYRILGSLIALHISEFSLSIRDPGEVWFRDHFSAANSMLYEARLSPAFWADAAAYSQYIFNRTSNDHIGDTTPLTVVTTERATWDRFKVFGCDCFENLRTFFEDIKLFLHVAEVHILLVVHGKHLFGLS
jgi:hypothetical protein